MFEKEIEHSEQNPFENPSEKSDEGVPLPNPMNQLNKKQVGKCSKIRI